MDRFKEPSTWAGFGILSQVLKSFMPPQWHILLDGISAATGSIAAALPEKARA